VGAITLADIPAELDKQIRQLRLAADEHNLKQDELLQTITTVRTQLEERIQGLQSVIEVVQGPDPMTRKHHDEQLDASRTVYTRVDQLSEVLESRSEQLESELKEQKQLMLAMKSFLEDKTSRPESILESNEQSAKGSIDRNSWPSSTLSTAYFAAILLSSVLSSVAATSIVTRQNRSLPRTARPVFSPIDYSLPGLGTLNKIQVPRSLVQQFANARSTAPGSESTVSTQAKPIASTEGSWVARAALGFILITGGAGGHEWVDDYRGTGLGAGGGARPRKRYPNPNDKLYSNPRRDRQFTNLSTGYGDSSGPILSKLNSL
jgi:hypothetical protein